MDNENELFIEYSKTRNKSIKNEIFLKNQKLVTFVVNRYYNKRNEHKVIREDLLQEGKIGLISAIDGFKPELGFRFSTYSIWWIKQSINNYLLSQMPLIKVPNNIRIKQNQIFRKLQEENKTFSDLIENKDILSNITERMLKSISASIESKSISSIEDTMNINDDEVKLKNILTNLNEKNIENNIDYKILKNHIKNCFDNLPEKEKMVLLLRYSIQD